jgi:hypothetical protein
MTTIKYLGIFGVIAYLGVNDFADYGVLYGTIMDVLEGVTKEAKKVNFGSKPKAILYMRQTLSGMGLPVLELICASKLYDADGIIAPENVRFYTDTEN